MDEKTYGVYRAGQLCNIDIFEMIEAVKTQQVEITVTMEPDRTEITVEPWRPYRAERVARVCLKCERNPMYCPDAGCEEYRAACRDETKEIRKRAKEG